MTETSAQAKEAIAYLKKNNLGRVTFMPLDSLKPTMPGDLERQALNCLASLAWLRGLLSQMRSTAGWWNFCWVVWLWWITLIMPLR
ncbi:hypothetical protein N752_23655 [Desulforamulus aquiferis]|nr:hypothetical protein [Desulforamulus aquiferis]RYD02780.1 hypothetical protein N752_23655 [Desulforamulus aquiferis]